MAIINPDGMFYGDRMQLLSDKARLLWPHIFIASNTVGRIEINYRKICNRAFSDFKKNPFEDEADFLSVMGEYFDAFLLYTYMTNGQLWGQWDTDKTMLQRFPLKADQKTPPPPENEFQDWKKVYRQTKRTKPFNIKTFTIPPENTVKTCRNVSGIGVGIGVGVGVGVGKNNPNSKSKTSPSPKTVTGDSRFTSTKDFVEKCCKHANVPFAWDGSEASHLARWLKANPNIPPEGVIELVKARFRGSTKPGERPRKWIGDLGQFANQGNGNGRISNSEQRQQQDFANIDAAAERLARQADESDAGDVPKLRH